ncbi:MAG: tRNA (5-methylaminomethyl-2-thiouridine)(34)-methyltransferase MnmD [Polaribacter sp.]|nr:tRNA (5-methylaminomethyl-2-thiouridine)(34)-methyltransferase MnmD [Polaribacter sp.]MBT5099056.1 tRNA (5-methylaminomethyl-2-thiouridine)(34)-methyltransferase MnmD [Polaribacter sp.]MBT5646197.1 tRNA (5-methylaminomethyl-2-thiouridine)(34)-methyltransferase MnmD [Polaribacter sp.]MBT7705560.1 tRNA (5-methylaminomethyl-2-thiouridine)(34)-methyltransferase MnmD [Polaribacter sp.]MDA9968523.1 tRNA (5-methylaminomethyl-2-thiouridine)(34)-methyltransferase MnmD [Polaribacter sp.]
MKREIIITSDGSTTIQLPDWNEQYHSKHGAIQEAYHVFLDTGFFKIDLQEIAILEIGFGTGLNAFITFLEAKKLQKKVNYVGVEAYPISMEEFQKLNYVSELKALEFQSVFDEMHRISWEKEHSISKDFQLLKRKQFFQDIQDTAAFDLIYFDAFGAQNQPELWTEAIFLKMYKAMKKEGVLVTYSAKGSVRRAMQAVGFMVERLPGPPGKREMLRATKR